MSEPAIELAPEVYDFLSVLCRFGEPATRRQIGCVTSLAAERARATAKRLGYARQRQRRDGKWGWQITGAGNVALAQARTARLSPTPPHSPSGMGGARGG